MSGLSDQLKGTAVASATTITASNKIFHVTGTAAIATINPPPLIDQAEIYLIPDGAFTTTTGGNIAKASTAVVGVVLQMFWDGSLWYPSY